MVSALLGAVIVLNDRISAEAWDYLRIVGSQVFTLWLASGYHYTGVPPQPGTRDRGRARAGFKQSRSAMTIAIARGPQRPLSRGAVRVTDGRSEYDWNGELAECMAQAWPHEVRVFRAETHRAPAIAREIEAVYAAR